MVDGVMLLVDASEGPLPQTRYVLSKALESPPSADSGYQQDSTAPTRGAAGGGQRSLRSVHRPRRPKKTRLIPNALIRTPSWALLRPTSKVAEKNYSPCSSDCEDHSPPKGDPAGPLQILVANLDYSDYLGRLAIARVFNGSMFTARMSALLARRIVSEDEITKLFSFAGLKRTDITETPWGTLSPSPASRVYHWRDHHRR